MEPTAPSEGAAAPPTAPPPLAANQVRLGRAVLTLTKPGSMALAYDVWLASGWNFPRAKAAALALCSTKVFHMTGGRVNYDIPAYGGHIIDTLIKPKPDGPGVLYLDLLDAGGRAYSFLTEGLTTEREVAELEGFTDPTSGSSTG